MFQAGFARVDVTPPLGTPVAGYGYKRISDHILDPLELNCVAFFDGESKGILISADVLQISESLATKIRGMIAKRLDLPADHVYLQALHQHTSIRVEIRAAGAGPDPAYLDVLFRKFCDVAQMALADLREAELFISEGQTSEKISFIRRYRLKDGTYKTNPGRGKSAVVDHPLGEADNTVRLLRFKREGGDIALVNFHCHPDVIGGTGFSADWPGFVRRYTEEALAGVKCILVGGPQGDSNHINVFRGKEEEEKRRGIPHSSFMGKTISDTLLTIWDRGRKTETGKIWGKSEIVYSRTNPKDKNDFLFQQIATSLLGIGSVAFVGFGGEPFTKYAKNAREAAKELYIIATCLTNGAAGYLPTEEAFAQGGYEVSAGKFSPCLEKDLTDRVRLLLNEYQSL